VTDYQTPGNPDMSAPRYTGIPTFMRAPLADTLENIDIALVGIPYDGALTNRPGARHGPREVRNQSSLMRAINHATRINPYELCKIADVGDVPFNSIFSIEDSHRDIEDFVSSVISGGAIPLSCGGDHSVSLPLLRATAKSPVALIHIDAHTDTWDSFQGSKFNHGAPFRRAHEEGLIIPEKTVQIGIRGAQNVSEGWDYSEGNGMRVMFIEEVQNRGIEAVVEETRAIIGDTPVYITFDIDSIDPAFAPGTGTPEIGGLTPPEALGLIRGFRKLNHIGADVVEISPPFDNGDLTSLTGATVMYELLCLLAETVSLR
jgi:guanidinopropionase